MFASNVFPSLHSSSRRRKGVIRPPKIGHHSTFLLLRTKNSQRNKKTTYLAPILVGSAMGTSAPRIPSCAFPFVLLVTLELVLPLAPPDEIDLAELLFFSEGGSP